MEKYMENTLETLIKLKKSTILNSKFKYTTYMGKMVSEYFFDISFPYRAEKYNFNNLINKLLLPQLPIFSFFDFIEYRHIYEKYPHLYLYFYNKAHYLVNIGKLCKHIYGYKHKIEIPYKFYHPNVVSLKNNVHLSLRLKDIYCIILCFCKCNFA